jgi:hypothetical protein
MCTPPVAPVPALWDAAPHGSRPHRGLPPPLPILPQFRNVHEFYNIKYDQDLRIKVCGSGAPRVGEGSGGAKCAQKRVFRSQCGWVGGGQAVQPVRTLPKGLQDSSACS